MGTQLTLHNYVYLLTDCSNGDVRLVGGATAQEGRVEFCYNNTWGTVCDDDWDSSDAVVVCRQLGFPFTGAIAYLNAFFGAGTGPILLDQVVCNGTESRLIDCPANAIGTNDCSHSEDAAVRCQLATPSVTTGLLSIFITMEHLEHYRQCHI